MLRQRCAARTAAFQHSTWKVVACPAAWLSTFRVECCSDARQADIPRNVHAAAILALTLAFTTPHATAHVLLHRQEQVDEPPWEAAQPKSRENATP